MTWLTAEEALTSINRAFYVYGLVNPITGKMFYIGKGCGKRLFEHERKVINNNKYVGNKHLTNTIKLIISSGLAIGYVILYNTNDESVAYEKEQYFISEYKNESLTNIHSGGRGRSSGKIENTYGPEIAKIIKSKVSKNHADVSGENNPRYKPLPDGITVVELDGTKYYEFNCANPNQNTGCSIKIRYPFNKRGKSKAMCGIGKNICLSCATSGMNNGMYGKPNPMAGKSTKDIWVQKHGIEKAEEMWKARNKNISIVQTGVQHSEETKRLIGIGNSKPKSEIGRLNIGIAARNRKKKAA